jgi:hypothetical protein
MHERQQVLHVRIGWELHDETPEPAFRAGEVPAAQEIAGAGEILFTTHDREI